MNMFIYKIEDNTNKILIDNILNIILLLKQKFTYSISVLNKISNKDYFFSKFYIGDDNVSDNSNNYLNKFSNINRRYNRSNKDIINKKNKDKKEFIKMVNITYNDIDTTTTRLISFVNKSKLDSEQINYLNILLKKTYNIIDRNYTAPHSLYSLNSVQPFHMKYILFPTYIVDIIKLFINEKISVNNIADFDMRIDIINQTYDLFFIKYVGYSKNPVIINQNIYGDYHDKKIKDSREIKEKQEIDDSIIKAFDTNNIIVIKEYKNGTRDSVGFYRNERILNNDILNKETQIKNIWRKYAYYTEKEYGYTIADFDKNISVKNQILYFFKALVYLFIKFHIKYYNKYKYESNSSLHYNLYDEQSILYNVFENIRKNKIVKNPKEILYEDMKTFVKNTYNSLLKYKSDNIINLNYALDIIKQNNFEPPYISIGSITFENKNNYNETNKNILKYIIPYVDIENQIYLSFNELLNYINISIKNKNKNWNNITYNNTVSDFYDVIKNNSGEGKAIMNNSVNYPFTYDKNDIYNRIYKNKIIMWKNKNNGKLMLSPNIVCKLLLLTNNYNYLRDYRDILIADPHLVDKDMNIIKSIDIFKEKYISYSPWLNFNFVLSYVVNKNTPFKTLFTFEYNIHTNIILLDETYGYPLDKPYSQNFYREHKLLGITNPIWNRGKNKKDTYSNYSILNPKKNSVFMMNENGFEIQTGFFSPEKTITFGELLVHLVYSSNVEKIRFFLIYSHVSDKEKNFDTLKRGFFITIPDSDYLNLQKDFIDVFLKNREVDIKICQNNNVCFTYI